VVSRRSWRREEAGTREGGTRGRSGTLRASCLVLRPVCSGFVVWFDCGRSGSGQRPVWADGLGDAPGLDGGNVGGGRRREVMSIKRGGMKKDVFRRETDGLNNVRTIL